MAIDHVVLPFTGFVAQAASRIVEQHRAAWPDLSQLLVLVPDLHCAGDIARALAQAGGGGALLLPRIATLPALAAGAELPYGITARITPQSVREVELYALLVRSSQFAETDIWALAGELTALFDRMTLARSPVAHDKDEFTEALRAAYRTGRNSALQFEATLVHELWWAQAPQRLDASRPASNDGRRLPMEAATIDPASAHALRLAAIAETIATPIFALALEQGDAVERSFLEACAARVPVVRFDAGWQPAGLAADQVLEAAWPGKAREPRVEPLVDPLRVPVRAPLRERAAALAAVHARSPFSGRLQVFGADSLEQEAKAIDVAVRRELLDGSRRVGVVVLDRLVARRARALLERAQVPVVDESGWLLSTTVAAACVGRLIDVVASGGYYRDLMDLLRSAFVFPGLAQVHQSGDHHGDRQGELQGERQGGLDDEPHADRQAALACIERVLARHDLAEGIPAMIALFGRDTPEEAVAVSLLERVGQAIDVLGVDTRKPLADWLDSLCKALDLLGARDALAADAAGADLLDLIARRRAELQGHGWRASFAQWRTWFTRAVEAANFRPRDVHSPVVFTYLAATRLRAFDMLVFAGADAVHLPAIDPPGRFFNQSVRARLGLPTREAEHAELECSLRLALTNVPRVLVTWQERLGGESNLLSPWFARLAALHRQAWPGDGLDKGGIGLRMIERGAVAARTLDHPVPLPVPASAPAPAAPPARAPSRISVSGYETLVACPYRYFAGTLLGLRPSEEVSEALEKSDFGELVHGILARFHGELPEVTVLGRGAAIERLQTLSRSGFAGAMRRNFIDRAWLARWVGSIPAYIDWQLEREAGGWRVCAVEAKRTLSVDTPAGRTLTLHGRLDRIDRRAPGDSLSVVDYKAQGVAELRKRAADPDEHVQLPAYALLAGDATRETLFLSIARDGVTSCQYDGDPVAAGEVNRVRLAALADRLHEQAPMPANGIEKVCEHCDMRGLCRRDFWVPASGVGPT